MASELYNPHLRTAKTTSVIMRDVCIALVPAMVASFIFFGVRALALIAVSVASCVVFEAAWQYLHKEELTVTDLSAVVTGIILAFNLSSATPIWVVIVAAAFSIIVVKQFFGGIGNNVFNPALMGRLFIMLVYPASIMSYVTPAEVDTVASATVLSQMKQGAELSYTVFDAFIGRIPGALGETSALFLLIGFAYLIYRREVNYTVSAAFFIALAVVVAAAGQNPLMHLFSGGAVLGGCFMLTDYNLSSNHGKVLYGVAAGIIAAAIRLWGHYPEGVCYAILIVNCMAPIIDRIYEKHVYGIS